MDDFSKWMNISNNFKDFQSVDVSASISVKTVRLRSFPIGRQFATTVSFRKQQRRATSLRDHRSMQARDEQQQSSGLLHEMLDARAGAVGDSEFFRVLHRGETLSLFWLPRGLSLS